LEEGEDIADRRRVLLEDQCLQFQGPQRSRVILCFSQQALRENHQHRAGGSQVRNNRPIQPGVWKNLSLVQVSLRCKGKGHKVEEDIEETNEGGERINDR